MKLILAACLLLRPALEPQEGRNAEDLFKDALAQAKDSKKKVFLTFVSPGGGWCSVFEAWKARPEVAPLLAKDFILLHVDSAGTPGARELKEKYPKAMNSGIPWFVILDAEGAEVADSNGPKGNIGCPNTDEEIEIFLGILKKVRLNLSDDDLRVLKKSLVEHRDKK